MAFDATVFYRGKAQQACSALSVTDAAKYVVKKAILTAYELVPEAYKQKFRGLRRDDQTHVEFAHKEVYFEHWCTFWSIGDDFNTLERLDAGQRI